MFIAIANVVTLVGYAMFVGSNNSHVGYAACFLVLAGSTSTAQLLLSWATENSAPETVRATTIAIVAGAGSIGSLISVWAYLPRDAPKYIQSKSFNLAGACIVLLLAIIGLLYINWENAKRDDGKRDNRLSGKSQAEIDELGSQHLNIGICHNSHVVILVVK